jgi:hypothetical protein
MELTSFQNKKALKILCLIACIMLLLAFAYKGGYAIGQAVAHFAQ